MLKQSNASFHKEDHSELIRPRNVNGDCTETATTGVKGDKKIARSYETIKMAQTNVCGWPKDNHGLRSPLIKCIDACICKTHLSGQN